MVFSLSIVSCFVHTLEWNFQWMVVYLPGLCVCVCVCVSGRLLTVAYIETKACYIESVLHVSSPPPTAIMR